MTPDLVVEVSPRIREGQRVPLVGPQGIFKPAGMRLPLSITTAPIVPGKEDEIGADDLIRYRYRGTDPSHRDNAGLREAMRRRVPLVYLYGVSPRGNMSGRGRCS